MEKKEKEKQERIKKANCRAFVAFVAIVIEFIAIAIHKTVDDPNIKTTALYVGLVACAIVFIFCALAVRARYIE